MVTLNFFLVTYEGDMRPTKVIQTYVKTHFRCEYISLLFKEIKRQSSREQKVVATLNLLLKSVKTYPECFLTGDNSFKPDEYCELK